MPSLEARSRAILERLAAESAVFASTGALSAETIRAVMAGRRVEELVAHRARLKAVQRRAIDLLRRVDLSAPIAADLTPSTREDWPIWEYCRHVLSSAPWTCRPGRAMYWWCVDTRTRGVLGVLDLGSDLATLGPRDAYLGWTRTRKYAGRGLAHLCNLGTCVAAQPFGWLTGGKFMAVAATSSRIIDAWAHRYGQTLAGVTTTSLYGRSSQYNRLPEYVYLGTTSGGGIYHLTATDFRTFKAYLRSIQTSTRSKQRTGNFVNRLETLQRVVAVQQFRPSVSSCQPRGVYLALLGDDARAFLRGEVATFAPVRRDLAAIRETWQDRWATMRAPKVAAQIQTFDYRVYDVDAQIDLAQQLHATLRDRSREIAAPCPHGEGGETPTRSLQSLDV